MPTAEDDAAQVSLHALAWTAGGSRRGGGTIPPLFWDSYPFILLNLVLSFQAASGFRHKIDSEVSGDWRGGARRAIPLLVAWRLGA